jgi:hypothetical protein
VIRRIEERDLPKLRELRSDWELETGCIGLVLVDENDVPVVFAGAWLLAETHIAIDSKWSTPGARLFALEQIHQAMNDALKEKGIRQAVTWFDGAKDRFRRRMEKWGWVASQKTSWHRLVR